MTKSLSACFEIHIDPAVGRGERPARPHGWTISATDEPAARPYQRLLKHALSILGLLLAITVSAQATNASASLAELPHWPIGLQLPAALGGQPPAKGPVKAKTLCNRDAAS